MSRWRRGTRSASAPAGTPTKNIGSARMPIATPTISGELVSSSTSQPSTTFSLIIPTELATIEAVRQRKSRNRKSARIRA